jgi:hypothetical protein
LQKEKLQVISIHYKEEIDMGDEKYWIKNYVMKELKKKEVELIVLTYSPH